MIKCDKFESLKNLREYVLALLVKPMVFSFSRLGLVNLPVSDVGSLPMVVRCTE